MQSESLTLIPNKIRFCKSIRMLQAFASMAWAKDRVIHDTDLVQLSVVNTEGVECKQNLASARWAENQIKPWISASWM